MDARLNFPQRLLDDRVILVRDLPKCILRLIGFITCLFVFLNCCVESAAQSPPHVPPNQSNVIAADEFLVGGRPLELVVDNQEDVVSDLVEFSPLREQKSQSIRNDRDKDVGKDLNYYRRQFVIYLFSIVSGAFVGWLSALWQIRRGRLKSSALLIGISPVKPSTVRHKSNEW